MAKRIRDADQSERTTKSWREAELINTFKLTRLVAPPQTPLMEEWLSVQMPELNHHEQYFFDRILLKGQLNVSGWNEEDLKIKFIGPILELGHLTDEGGVVGYFDKTISGTVDGIKLSVKSDFMFAKGLLDVFETPYFHFQEYKPYKNPTGDSMAQLLEAFLIAQNNNNNGKPMYGVDIMGANWRFVTMEGREYCISEAYDSVNKTDLLAIISILRNFKHILVTRLMVD
jgi:hypothetical protein